MSVEKLVAWALLGLFSWCICYVVVSFIVTLVERI